MDSGSMISLGRRDASEEEEQRQEKRQKVERAMISYDDRWVCMYKSCKILPGDVLTDILLRLPVKSLMRFKCVSKTWNRFVTCPTFVSLHLNYSRAKNKGCLIIQGRTDGGRLPLHYTLPTKLIWGLQLNMPHSFIVGCSHGLVCLNDKGYNFWIWNPATRNLASVPPLVKPGTFNPQDELHLFCWEHSGRKNDEIGFCFLPEYNDIKLAFLHHPKKEIHVFTWSTGNWKTIEDPLLLSVTWFAKYCLNDKYWIGVASSPKDFAVYFDMIEETLGLVKCPSGIISPRFTCWKQSLALFTYQKCNLNWLLDVWILNEPSSPEGLPWMKLFTIRMMGGPDDFIPRGFWTDGRIIFRHGWMYRDMLYDQDTRCWVFVSRHMKLLEFEWLFNICNFFPYYESLIPLKS